MLTELRTIHDDLLAAIADLAQVVARPAFDESELTDTRWKLSRASGRRLRFLEQAVYPHVLKHAAPADAQAVETLRAEAAILRAASADHIGRWTIPAIGADWAGYQRASAAMTQSMRERVAREKEVLYPLLEGQ